MKRKRIIFWIFLALITIFLIDFILVSYDRKPIFVIRTGTYKDGGTKEYLGLGYKVIGWNRLAYIEVDSTRQYGHLKGYEISVFPILRDVNQGPKKQLKFVPTGDSTLSR